VATRADFNLVKSWDAVVEWRSFATPEAGSTRTGFLAVVHRHLTDEVRLGVGYNFTDFSDDLTVIEGRARGAFVNLVAAF
jgi:hypothetical protein